MTISWTGLPTGHTKGFCRQAAEDPRWFCRGRKSPYRKAFVQDACHPAGRSFIVFGIDTALEQKGPERENALKILTKKRLFIAKHYDFLIVDLAALILGYWLSLSFRRSLDITLRNQNLLWTYGIAALASFLLVEILTENLNGVITRGLVREVQAVALQMTLTWTVYLSVLFLMHNIFALSRILTIVTYLICAIFLLLFRNGWKMICKFSRVSDSVMPELLIVCEASHAQRVLNRLVSGALSKQYDICGLVVNEKSELNYKDWYPCETGLDRIDAFTGERRIQYAYVELNDRKEEQEAIDKLLKAGIIVHRSMGDSVLQYANQSIGQLNGKSVIVISGARSSLVSKADRAWLRLKHKLLRDKE